MTLSSLQDCIAVIQCSTTRTVAGPRFLASPAHARTAQASTTQYMFLPRTQKHKGKLSTALAQRARKTYGTCFQIPGRQVSPLHKEPRYHLAGPQQHLLFSGKHISQLLLSVEVHWQPLSHREARSIYGYHYRKEGKTAILQLLMTVKTFLLVWAAFSTPRFLRSDSAHILYPLLLAQQLHGTSFSKFSPSQYKGALLEYPRYSSLPRVKQHGQAEGHAQNGRLHSLPRGIT